jgi:hypothetical protein
LDYPLSKTQIIWDHDDPEGHPPARLCLHKKEDDRRYSASWGACDAEFLAASDAERVNMLMLQFVHMTVVGGINARELHATFMDIPEYRRALASAGSIDPALVDDWPSMQH